MSLCPRPARMRRAATALTALILSLFGMEAQNISGRAAQVNPFIGASTNTKTAKAVHGLGKTFPGATTPFGMVQVSPQTITGGDNGPGYSYEHRTIEGFAMTQMSGIGWYGDLGNIMVMPTTGRLLTLAGKEGTEGWRSAYDKQTEKACAGYYSVVLSDYDIRVETSATQHCGALRFTYPASKLSRLQFDLARRVGGTSTEQFVEVTGDHTIEGWVHCPPEGGGWGNGDGKAEYTVFFHAELSKPLTNYGFWSAEIPDGTPRRNFDVSSQAYQERIAKASIIREGKSMEGKHIGFFTEFPTEAGEQVELKVGISFVDIEGARRNFESEARGKSFATICQQAIDTWNRELGRIDVEGGTPDEQTIFYTALYHTMIDPRIYADVDGRYVGGDYKIHRSDATFTKRTIFSG